ncbi:MAG: glycosyltransferase family 9 protein [Bdellovibrionota bacterium]
MKILLAKRRALGDTVLLSSTISGLAAALPGAEIYALVPGAFAPVLEGHPSLRGVLSYDSGFFSLVRSVRALGLDHFVQLHSSPSQRWLGRFSGAALVRHSVQNNETEKAFGKHPNALEWDGFFLRTLFGAGVSVPLPEPRIFLSEAERAAGAHYWRAQGVDPARVVFLGLGASRPTKRWPPVHFARLAELLRDRLELVPAFIVGPGEVEQHFAAAVLDQMRVRGLRAMGAGGKGDFVHGAGLGVRSLAGALSAVRAYVGNDSGPKHLAAAVGVPTLTFFGPEDPGEWHPYARERHPVLFQSGLACRREDGGRWCGIEVCTVERHRCMVDLDPLDALEIVKRLG